MNIVSVLKLIILTTLTLLTFNIVQASVPSLPKDSAPWIGKDLKGMPCQGGEQGFGPYDYTNPSHRGEPLQLVESAHFLPKQELEVGKYLGDMDYTLRAFPNHHRAMYAIIRYHLTSVNQRVGRFTPPECYLQRALNFKRDDGTIWMLYGLYLHKAGRLADADKYYQQAERLMPNYAELHYNYGLLLFDLKEFDQAQQHAKKAYQLGYPLAGLREKLKRAGYWK